MAELKNCPVCGTPARMMVHDGCYSVKPIVPRWIPVEERLPEELTDVLTKCGHGAAWFYGLAHLFEGKWKVDGIGGSVDIVTHWMPLPEPPEEVRHE